MRSMNVTCFAQLLASSDLFRPASTEVIPLAGGGVVADNDKFDIRADLCHYFWYCIDQVGNALAAFQPADR
jgi:hypothetical protein